MRNTRKTSLALLCIAAAGLGAGCSLGPATVTVDIDQPEPVAAPTLTLGAGDSLGWRVYQQDVYLAMRDGYSRGIYQPSLFPDVRIVEVPVD